MPVKGQGFQGPLDPVEDFGQPLHPIADVLAAYKAGMLAESPELHHIESCSTCQEVLTAMEAPHEEEEGQQLVLEGAAAPDTPKVIRNGKMLCEYVRPHVKKEESGTRHIALEFSFPLTPEHAENGNLPIEVLREWEHIRSGGNTTWTEVESVEPQTISVGLVPDDPNADFVLVAAHIISPVLAKVEEKGSGKKNKIIRFSFRAMLEQTDRIAHFAFTHYGEQLWISIQRTQASLLDE